VGLCGVNGVPRAAAGAALPFLAAAAYGGCGGTAGATAAAGAGA
jgi:hypothetical protein